MKRPSPSRRGSTVAEEAPDVSEPLPDASHAPPELLDSRQLSSAHLAKRSHVSDEGEAGGPPLETGGASPSAVAITDDEPLQPSPPSIHSIDRLTIEADAKTQASACVGAVPSASVGEAAPATATPVAIIC